MMEQTPDVQEIQAATVAQVGQVALRSGDACPVCQAGRMDYDGLLNLRCECCGYTQVGGCYT